MIDEQAIRDIEEIGRAFASNLDGIDQTAKALEGELASLDQTAKAISADIETLAKAFQTGEEDTQQRNQRQCRH